MSLLKEVATFVQKGFGLELDKYNYIDSGNSDPDSDAPSYKNFKQDKLFAWRCINNRVILVPAPKDHLAVKVPIRCIDASNILRLVARRRRLTTVTRHAL